MVAVLSITESGVIAARWGGLVGADEELADPAVGDAGHADPAVQHPGLAGDGLHDVVAVEALQLLEVVEGAAGAAGAAHVHVDDRVAEQVEDRLMPLCGPGRIGVSVARVLDQGRIGPGGRGPGSLTSIARLVPSRVVR